MNYNKRLLLLIKLFFLLPILSFSNKTLNQPNNDCAIIFTTNQWQARNPTDTRMFKQNFSIVENIYAHVDLKKTLKQVYQEQGLDYDFKKEKYNYNYGFRLIIDGENKSIWTYEMPESGFNSITELMFVLSPSPGEKYEYSNVTSDWVNHVMSLSPGAHNVRLEMVALNIDEIKQNPPVICAGNFTLEVSAVLKDEFFELKSIGLPDATWSDYETEQAIVKASKKLYDDAVPKKAIIIDKNGGWRYQKNRRDVVENRNIIAAVVYEIGDGICWIKTGWYTQKHEGKNQWGSMQFSRETRGYYDYKLPCAKVLDKD